MLALNEARITGIRCRDAGSGSLAGVVTAGSALDLLVAVEAGAGLFATGARFAAGVQVEGIAAGAIELVEGWLGDPRWPSAVAELSVRVPGTATADLADRLVGVAAFLRVNLAPPFAVSTLRGADVFVAPAAFADRRHTPPAVTLPPIGTAPARPAAPIA